MAPKPSNNQNFKTPTYITTIGDAISSFLIEERPHRLPISSRGPFPRKVSLLVLVLSWALIFSIPLQFFTNLWHAYPIITLRLIVSVSMEDIVTLIGFVSILWFSFLLHAILGGSALSIFKSIAGLSMGISSSRAILISTGGVPHKNSSDV
jgi:hypothetical protein